MTDQLTDAELARIEGALTAIKWRDEVSREDVLALVASLRAVRAEVAARIQNEEDMAAALTIEHDAAVTAFERGVAAGRAAERADVVAWLDQRIRVAAHNEAWKALTQERANIDCDEHVGAASGAPVAHVHVYLPFSGGYECECGEQTDYRRQPFAAPVTPWSLVEKHMQHYRSCDCLGDAAECCVASCECHAVAPVEPKP